MGYTLLWLESLWLAAVLFLMVITALAAHAQRSRARRVLPLLIGSVMIVLAGVAAAFIGFLQFGTMLQPTWFGHVLIWCIVFILSAVVVLFRGLRRGTEKVCLLRRHRTGESRASHSLYS